MTTEEDFQKALDRNPTDWQTRLVFADWLQDRGDERAEGYRALGMLRKLPLGTDPRSTCPYWISPQNTPSSDDLEPHRLQTDWYAELVVKGKDEICAPRWHNDTSATRRGLEDAAALAFAKLPAARQAELLSAPLEVASS